MQVRYRNREGDHIDTAVLQRLHGSYVFDDESKCLRNSVSVVREKLVDLYGFICTHTITQNITEVPLVAKFTPTISLE